eukprot:4159672-Prymnesium_polylepis.1
MFSAVCSEFGNCSNATTSPRNSSCGICSFLSFRKYSGVGSATIVSVMHAKDMCVSASVHISICQPRCGKPQNSF